jgi:hypothetical protein
MNIELNDDEANVVYEACRDLLDMYEVRLREEEDDNGMLNLQVELLNSVLNKLTAKD